MENGISSAKRKFSSKPGMKISSSTVHSIKVAYKKKRYRSGEKAKMKTVRWKYYQLKKGADQNF